MPSCSEMKKGDVYTCPDCGLELQVIKECRDCGTSGSDCGCDPSEPCTFSCCGKDMVKKGA